METCRRDPFPVSALPPRPCLACAGGARRLLDGREPARRRQDRLPLGTGTRTSGLEVPPDLTQLAKDTRYQPPSGVVSASTFQAPTGSRPPAARPRPAAASRSARRSSARRAAASSGSATSAGSARTLPPEQVFPQVRAFWKDNGFNLVQDRADAGVLETDWAENRAKLPNDIIRSTIGKVFDGAFSTGELDKFRTRIERTATGSDIYITHRGMVEVYTGERKEATVWQPRPADPQLEAEFLSRLMVKLGAKEEEAAAAVAAATDAGAGAAGARPHASTAGRPDAAGRRRLRPRLAARRPRARPQRLHGRGPRPRPRACTSCATSTRRSPARRSPASSPSCSASAQEATTAQRSRKYRVKVTGEGNDAARSPCSIRRARPRTAKPASASSACCSTT